MAFVLLRGQEAPRRCGAEELAAAGLDGPSVPTAHKYQESFVHATRPAEGAQEQDATENRLASLVLSQPVRGPVALHIPGFPLSGPHVVQRFLCAAVRRDHEQKLALELKSLEMERSQWIHCILLRPDPDGSVKTSLVDVGLDEKNKDLDLQSVREVLGVSADTQLDRKSLNSWPRGWPFPHAICVHPGLSNSAADAVFWPSAATENKDRALGPVLCYGETYHGMGGCGDLHGYTLEDWKRVVKKSAENEAKSAAEKHRDRELYGYTRKNSCTATLTNKAQS